MTVHSRPHAGSAIHFLIQEKIQGRSSLSKPFSTQGNRYTKVWPIMICFEKQLYHELLAGFPRDFGDSAAAESTWGLSDPKSPHCQPYQKLHTVFIIDKDPCCRSELERLLALEGYNVVCFDGPARFLEFCKPVDGSCLLLDCTSGNGWSGMEVFNQINANGRRIPVVFMSGSCDVPEIVQAIKSGVDGFIAKPIAPPELLDAVKHALDGKDGKRTESEKRRLTAKTAMLTDREREVIRYVAQGMLNKEIAARLGLAVITVKTQRASAMHKLGAGNAAELTRIAIRMGLVDPAGVDADPFPETPGVQRGLAQKPDS